MIACSRPPPPTTSMFMPFSPPALVMEQANARERHGDAVFVARGDYVVIANGTARLRDIGHAALVRALHVIAKGEERIAAQRHILQALEPFALFLCGERLRPHREILLPHIV